ncbi:Golgi apparatus membrane protein TVP18 [Xylariomycetidae sp. FL0641]|nr:Golgi apparatus membrane protein TVP18 [Xylariomycetidae sp. FL0641]
MSIKDEFATRNFSIYGQWLGILAMILCFALGIANLFNLFGHFLLIIFAIFALVSCFIILFIEVPLLLRICPTSSSFDSAIRKISSNYMRAAAYGIMAVIQWISAIWPSSLIAAAVVLTLTAVCYALAGLKGQAFVGSKTLGGAGVAQMIV